MKRLLPLVATIAALWAGACGGGGTQPPPPPPKGPFSNASLNGQYAFSMTGSEIASSNLTASNLFTRAGTFTADGKGNVTDGVEDVNLVSGPTPPLHFTGGSYAVSADGRGTLSLINSTGTLQFSITLTSSSTGYITAMPTDGLSTASGNLFKQDPSAFSLSGIANNYAFDLSGISPNAAAESIIGQFFSTGAGVIRTGFEDDNDGGTVTNSSIVGVYAADGLNMSDLPNFGRGQFTLGSVQGVFYIVDHTRVLLLETVSGGALLGTAVSQANIPMNNTGISGGFVFVMGGGAVAGPITRGGRLTANGGNVSAVFIDNNLAGQVTSQNPGTGSYTIDSAGSGRGTITFTEPGVTGTFNFVFYLISPTQGFLQDQTANFEADGTLLGQPSMISDSSLAGNYAFSWSGVSSTDVTTDEEDFVGQLNLSAGSFTGALDLNEFASGRQFTDLVTNGTLNLSADPTTHNAFVANLVANPSAKLTFFAYVGNNGTILLMGTQSNVRVIAGVLSFQSPQ